MKALLPVLLLLALSAGPARAADEPAPDVPEPAGLPGDWWSFFEPKEALDSTALGNRIEAAKQRYAAIREQLEKTGDRLLLQQVDGILADLDRYLELRNLPPPVAPVLASSAERYTLDDALVYFGDWLALKQQIEAEAEETAWQATVLGERRKQQSRLRSKYLEMDAQAPDRLVKGLDLVRKRLALELQRLNHDRRKSLLKQDEERLARMRTELDGMAERLVADPDELKRWDKLHDEAQAAIERLRDEAERIPARVVRSEAASPDPVENQYAALASVRRDIEIRIQELTAIRADNSRLLIRLTSGAPDVDSGSVRAGIDVFEELDGNASRERMRWEQVLNRMRGLISDTGAEVSTAMLQGLHASMRGELDRGSQLLQRLQREQLTGEFVVRLLSAGLHAREGWLNRSLGDLRGGFVKSASSTVDLLGVTLFEINETPVTTLGLLRVVLILSIALWLSRIIRRAIQHVGERRGGLNQSSLYTFGRLVHYLILTVGIIIGLSSVGIDFTKFALFASALGVGIGFGLQTLISNFVAGLIILFEKSLKVGDFVELESGVTGEVKEINMRSTLITTNDNIDILVPNSEFVGGRVINWTLREVHRRVRVPFGVAYGTDKDKVRTAVLEAADHVEWTLKGIKSRRPQVWFVEFGDSSLNFELVVWLTPEAVKRPGAVTAAYLWEIETRLGKYGIEVPFPQRDLHLRSAFGLRDDDALTAFRVNAAPDHGAAS